MVIMILLPVLTDICLSAYAIYLLIQYQEETVEVEELIDSPMRQFAKDNARLIEKTVAFMGIKSSKMYGFIRDNKIKSLLYTIANAKTERRMEFYSSPLHQLSKNISFRQYITDCQMNRLNRLLHMLDSPSSAMCLTPGFRIELAKRAGITSSRYQNKDRKRFTESQLNTIVLLATIFRFNYLHRQLSDVDTPLRNLSRSRQFKRELASSVEERLTRRLYKQYAQYALRGLERHAARFISPLARYMRGNRELQRTTISNLYRKAMFRHMYISTLVMPERVNNAIPHIYISQPRIIYSPMWMFTMKHRKDYYCALESYRDNIEYRERMKRMITTAIKTSEYSPVYRKLDIHRFSQKHYIPRPVLEKVYSTLYIVFTKGMHHKFISNNKVSGFQTVDLYYGEFDVQSMCYTIVTDSEASNYMDVVELAQTYKALAKLTDEDAGVWVLSGNHLFSIAGDQNPEAANRYIQISFVRRDGLPIDQYYYTKVCQLTDQYIETLRASANANTNNDVFLNTGVKVALVNGWLGTSREIVVTLVSPYTSGSLKEASINLIENINQISGLIFAKIADDVRWINI